MLLYELYIKNVTKRLEKLFCKHRFATYHAKPHSLLYVAANCLPYHVSGYTIRTHEILVALKKHGVDVQVLTQAGYPWNHFPTACNPSSLLTEYQGIHYYHVQRSHKYSKFYKYINLISFVYNAAKSIVRYAQKFQVACIHAASNYVNALPALLAAHWLNIPFQYEMRGHWELSRKAQHPMYAYTFAYHLGLYLEEYVAQKANRIFCISEALAQFVHLKINHENVHVLPNCVDSERIRPISEQKIMPRHLGYAGALVDYEGIDILLYALSELKNTYQDVFLHIVGQGKAQSRLKLLTGQLGLQNNVHFYGKVSPDEARALLKPCALVCIPRLPVEVCTMVPPIKLVEAMSLGKALVLPHLPVFHEEMKMVPAYFFEAGNARHLAKTLKNALDNTESLLHYGEKCRHYVLQHRQWKYFVPSIISRC